MAVFMHAIHTGNELHIIDEPRTRREGLIRCWAELNTAPDPDVILAEHTDYEARQVFRQPAMLILRRGITISGGTEGQRRAAFFPIILRMLAVGYRDN